MKVVMRRQGAFDARPVALKTTGRWPPEFGCYVLFRPTLGAK